MRTFLIAATLLRSPRRHRRGTRNFGITSFEKLRIEGPYHVRLTTGVAPFARATGSPAALDRVAIEMRAIRSSCTPTSSWGGYPGPDLGSVEIIVGTHDLTSAWLNGSGALQIDKVKGLTSTSRCRVPAWPRSARSTSIS